jgi:hypothetical protein
VALSAGCGCGLFGDPAEANADRDASGTTLASLSWKAEPKQLCIDADSLKKRVEAHLGREVFRDPDRADVAIAVAIETAPGDRLRAVVRITAGDSELGVRTLEEALSA